MTNKKELKNNILKILKINEINFPISSVFSGRDIETITQRLDAEGLISFDIQERSNGADYWLQVEYYSKKIKKTIIFDYDANSDFEDIDELVDYLFNIEKEITEFEKTLSIKKPKSYEENCIVCGAKLNNDISCPNGCH